MTYDGNNDGIPDNLSSYAPSLASYYITQQSNREAINNTFKDLYKSNRLAYHLGSFSYAAGGMITNLVTSPINLYQQIDIAFRSNSDNKKKTIESYNNGFR